MSDVAQLRSAAASWSLTTRFTHRNGVVGVCPALTGRGVLSVARLAFRSVPAAARGGGVESWASANRPSASKAAQMAFSTPAPEEGRGAPFATGPESVRADSLKFQTAYRGAVAPQAALSGRR